VSPDLDFGFQLAKTFVALVVLCSSHHSGSEDREFESPLDVGNTLLFSLLNLHCYNAD
jgi:hypothetical protein